MKSKIIVTRMLFALLITLGTLSLAASQQDFYERGVALQARGEWEQALKTWWEGFNALESEGLADPRIGVAFIELATQMQAERYYGTACDLYLKSFSGDSSKEHTAVVTQEFLAISPFLKDSEYKNLKLALERGEASTVATGIKEFWLKKDPTPSTPGNERLISHWLRIAYAKANFDQNMSAVYGTDDRGVIYVLFGEPAKKVWGRIRSNFTDITEFFTTTKEKNTGEYEIWTYSTAKSEEPIIFMFRRDTNSSYGIVADVVEFTKGFDGSELAEIELSLNTRLRDNKYVPGKGGSVMERRDSERNRQLGKALMDQAKKRDNN